MKLAPHATTMSMLCKLYIVLLAVVAIAVSEIELTTEKKQCLEMNFMIVVFAMMIFLCGVGVGVVSMYVTKVRVSKVTKVRAYPTGRRYHCFTCTSTSFTSNDRLQCPKEITIEQAEEQRLTPCKCKACDKTWKALS
jgi:hypothetical protein